MLLLDLVIAMEFKALAQSLEPVTLDNVELYGYLLDVCLIHLFKWYDNPFDPCFASRQ